MRWLLVAVTALGLGAAISTGSARTLRTGDDLQRALTEAKPGDTILLERGATFTGNFVLPAAGPPSDGRVITLRTAGDDGMPAEGGRISPEAAGPLAKIHSPNGSPALGV